jgi:hypothetical protein
MPRCDQCDSEMWQDLQGRWICFTCVLFYHGHVHTWAEENLSPPPPKPTPDSPPGVRYWEFDQPSVA